MSPWAGALERARVAQLRIDEVRRTVRAELELRNAAIVEAYEAGCGVRRASAELGLSTATIDEILSRN